MILRMPQPLPCNGAIYRVNSLYEQVNPDSPYRSPMPDQELPLHPRTSLILQGLHLFPGVPEDFPDQELK